MEIIQSLRNHPRILLFLQGQYCSVTSCIGCISSRAKQHRIKPKEKTIQGELLKEMYIVMMQKNFANDFASIHSCFVVVAHTF